jgi:enamine deaminase RidA (YjgF/YER057c/UK114 family)
MHTRHNPSDVPKPASAYSQGIEVKPNARWLYISGQIGVSPDGTAAKGAAAQAEQAWSNIANTLKAAGMGMNDLVKITTFICNAADLPAVRAARDKYIAGAQPASTLIVVAGLASKDWLIEIEAVAAKA